MYNSFYMPYLLEGLELYQYISILSLSSNLLFTVFSLFKSFDSFEKSPNLASKYISILISVFFKTQILPLNSKFYAISEAKDLVYTNKYIQTLASSLYDSPFFFTSYCLNNFRPFSNLPILSVRSAYYTIAYHLGENILCIDN